MNKNTAYLHKANILLLYFIGNCVCLCLSAFAAEFLIFTRDLLLQSLSGTNFLILWYILCDVIKQNEYHMLTMEYELNKIRNDTSEWSTFGDILQHAKKQQKQEKSLELILVMSDVMTDRRRSKTVTSYFSWYGEIRILWFCLSKQPIIVECICKLPPLLLQHLFAFTCFKFWTFGLTTKQFRFSHRSKAVQISFILERKRSLTQVKYGVNKWSFWL